MFGLWVDGGCSGPCGPRANLAGERVMDLGVMGGTNLATFPPGDIFLNLCI